ncbi:formyltetrahydrofolate-dependent phosphoribosylglycinamide formyltransferase [Magnetococcus marinus MC-1]|uniref:Phosphoribosylglycinamide formyltransferase n=1 Tax=Magnetococcus marinus (strain ATCC BAA-1437 / JCM 17883 / MC-1) TaxID=156889 RepID=A0LA24_MAGMM|nr:phosphoribosylglycinamide formyltransferase [Magnetococcus marinus]ABK44817.1 formyltetrahydrofolate-dependent phosphoribosylglycinamide formyltransferase [Magnetococcus marinus MC-1]
MSGASFRIGVLISGSGSNLQALIDGVKSGFIPAEIALVISNKADAYGLTRAREAGIETRVVDHKTFEGRSPFEHELIRALDDAGVELVCLAGFMRVLTPLFVRHYLGRLINIHPSLLPAFAGLHVQQRAIDAGVRFSGCTVHFVEEEVDAGPIIAQAVVPVLPSDRAEDLAKRILTQEHRLYPWAVKLFVEGRTQVKERVVHIQPAQWGAEQALIGPTPD